MAKRRTAPSIPSAPAELARAVRAATSTATHPSSAVWVVGTQIFVATSPKNHDALRSAGWSVAHQTDEDDAIHTCDRLEPKFAAKWTALLRVDALLPPLFGESCSDEGGRVSWKISADGRTIFTPSRLPDGNASLSYRPGGAASADELGGSLSATLMNGACSLDFEPSYCIEYDEPGYREEWTVARIVVRRGAVPQNAALVICLRDNGFCEPAHRLDFKAWFVPDDVLEPPAWLIGAPLPRIASWLMSEAADTIDLDNEHARLLKKDALGWFRIDPDNLRPALRQLLVDHLKACKGLELSDTPETLAAVRVVRRASSRYDEELDSHCRVGIVCPAKLAERQGYVAASVRWLEPAGSGRDVLAGPMAGCYPPALHFLPDPSADESAKWDLVREVSPRAIPLAMTHVRSPSMDEDIPF
jgi:hypothetical protein